MCPYTYVYACTHGGDLEVSVKLGSDPLSLIHSNSLKSVWEIQLFCLLQTVTLSVVLLSSPGGPWAWGGIVPRPYSHGGRGFLWYHRCCLWLLLVSMAIDTQRWPLLKSVVQ